MGIEAGPQDFGLEEDLPWHVGAIEKTDIPGTPSTVFQQSIEGESAFGMWEKYLGSTGSEQIGFVFKDNTFLWTAAGKGFGHQQFFGVLCETERKQKAREHIKIAVRPRGVKPVIVLLTNFPGMEETLIKTVAYFQKSINSPVLLLYQTPAMPQTNIVGLNDFAKETLQK